jgi:hypothetical protein
MIIVTCTFVLEFAFVIAVFYHTHECSYLVTEQFETNPVSS